jgi:hypothetical protein
MKIQDRTKNENEARISQRQDGGTK